MTDYSRIFSSNPVNATAGRVISRSAETFEPNQKPVPHVAHWKAPPPLAPHPTGIMSASFVDHTGVEFGRFRVIGYLGKRNPKGKAVWLVRCSCGDYEERTARAIQNPANVGDRCFPCQYIERVKQGRGNSPFRSEAAA